MIKKIVLENFLKTDYHKKNMGQKNLNILANIVSLKRIAYPNKISNSVMFACDPKSSFIINTILNIRKGEQSL